MSFENLKTDLFRPGKDQQCSITEAEFCRLLPDMLADMKNQNRAITILKQRYGLDGFEPSTFQAIGDAYGLSRGRIMAIIAKTLRYIRHPRNTHLFKS